MDWFERLTGFIERDYEDTRSRLEVTGQTLRSRVNGREYGIGELELVSLQTLRDRAGSSSSTRGRLRLKNITADVGDLHESPAYAGALFQAASQFNLLEMVSPDVTPEHGVTGYQYDLTQGPACAIAAGAATIYRNYFVPVDGASGQTRARQLDGLAGIGAHLSGALAKPVRDLWTMRNGYALCSREGLAAIGGHLRSLTPAERDRLGARLRIGVHSNVEVTRAGKSRRQTVSQAFCSALPVAYSRVPAVEWQPFAELVLEAAYEATLWAGVLNARQGSSNIVLLTRLGGGAFGNEPAWIDEAMQHALTRLRDFDLDVRLVSLGAPPRSMLELEKSFA